MTIFKPLAMDIRGLTFANFGRRNDKTLIIRIEGHADSQPWTQIEDARVILIGRNIDEQLRAYFAAHTTSEFRDRTETSGTTCTKLREHLGLLSPHGQARPATAGRGPGGNQRKPQS